ncbi:MAG TPA: CDP-alcohol phosphatidyltransferase family protein [Marinobacterium sp.]|nr:CDP-alcohol phosphatidyltransferase family protein [Marinobacterium sp.]
MFDARVLEASRDFIEGLAQNLHERGVKADQVTWAGFAIGLSALPLLALGAELLAMIAILTNRIADGVDGALARKQGPTDTGAFLDIVLDFIFYAAVPLGFALQNPEQNAAAAALLLFSFIGTASSFLAFAIFAERRQLKSTEFTRKGFYYLGGLTEATETIGLFLICSLFPSLFPTLATLFALLCLLTTAMRLRSGMEALSHS